MPTVLMMMLLLTINSTFADTITINSDPQGAEISFQKNIWGIAPIVTTWEFEDGDRPKFMVISATWPNGTTNTKKVKISSSGETAYTFRNTNKSDVKNAPHQTIESFQKYDGITIPKPSNFIEEAYANFVTGQVPLLRAAAIAKGCQLRSQGWYSSILNGVMSDAIVFENEMIKLASNLESPPDMANFRSYAREVVQLVLYKSTAPQVTADNFNEKCSKLLNSEEMDALDRAQNRFTGNYH